MDEEIDVPDQIGTNEIDLTDKLRFAAGALAADFGDDLTADYAEALVFRSAEGLLARASVTEFVPILAERRARQVVRAGGAPTGSVTKPATEADLASEPADPPAVEAPTVELPEVGAEPVALVAIPVALPDSPAPLIALPAEDLSRMRERLDRVRVRLSDWRADLDQR